MQKTLNSRPYLLFLIFMKNKVIFSVSIILILCIVACNNYQPKKSDNGKLRIASLSPYFTHMIYVLNAQENLVGCSSYCITDPQDSIEIVSSVVNVNIEKLAIIKPDVVFTTNLMDPKNIEAIRNLGIKTDTLGKVTSVNTIYEHFLYTGKFVGKQELAQNIVTREKARIDSIRKTIPVKNDSLKVFFQIGANPVFTVLQNTFMNDFITLANCKNIAKSFEHGTITRESVVLSNPDVIFIATMGVVAEEEKKEWEEFKNLNAVKNNKVFIVDAYKSCSPGPVTFTDMFEEIVHLIYN